MDVSPDSRVVSFYSYLFISVFYFPLPSLDFLKEHISFCANGDVHYGHNDSFKQLPEKVNAEDKIKPMMVSLYITLLLLTLF